jgi:hypothetical protein
MNRKQISDAIHVEYDRRAQRVMLTSSVGDVRVHRISLDLIEVIELIKWLKATADDILKGRS